MDMISERDVGGSALLSHSGSQSGSSREGGGTNFTSGGGGGLSGKVGDAGTTSTMVGGGGGIVVASNMESNEPLSLLLQKQKSKYVAVIERSQVEIKRYRVEAERLRSEVSILKDVLSISTGIRFDAKDLKEAVTAYQNATMHIEMHRFATKVGGVGSVGGAPPAAEKGHGGAMRAKTANGMKVLPPIEKKGDSSNNNNINNKQAKVTTETTLTHHETGTISQQQQQQQHHEEPVHLSDEELSILTTARQRIASDLLILKNNSKPNGKIDREVEGGGDGGGEGEEEMSSITTIPPIEMPLLPTKLSESFNKRVMGIQAIRKKQHKELFDRT